MEIKLVGKEAIMSKHYFVGTLPQGKIIEQDIPIFGFQTGKTVMNPWPSAKAETRDEFKDLTIVVNPQVSLHFAMPKKTALMFFPINKKYEKVTLDAYKPNSGGYMSGSVIRIVFTAVSVQFHSQINDFPIPAGVQKRYFETDKGMGRDFLIGYSVKLSVQRAEVV